MSTASNSPFVLGAGSLSVLLFGAAALALCLGVIGTFSVADPALTIAPVTVVVVVGSLVGAVLFGTVVCLLSLAR